MLEQGKLNLAQSPPTNVTLHKQQWTRVSAVKAVVKEESQGSKRSLSVGSDSNCYLHSGWLAGQDGCGWEQAHTHIAATHRGHNSIWSFTSLFTFFHFCRITLIGTLRCVSNQLSLSLFVHSSVSPHVVFEIVQEEGALSITIMKCYYNEKKI